MAASFIVNHIFSQEKNASKTDQSTQGAKKSLTVNIHQSRSGRTIKVGPLIFQSAPVFNSECVQVCKGVIRSHIMTDVCISGSRNPRETVKVNSLRNARQEDIEELKVEEEELPPPSRNTTPYSIRGILITPDL